MADQTIQATGKRKCAIAQVRMTPGAGQIIVNRRAIEDYFGRETSRMIVVAGGVAERMRQFGVGWVADLSCRSA